MDPVLKKLTCKRTDVNAATITRQSKSNLALAFISLGRERKRDIIIFYAFCRVIDDIADSAELTLAEKELRLTEMAPDAPGARSRRVAPCPGRKTFD